MSRALPPRGAGVLLHVTSLPGRYGAGDLGPEARNFVRFLARAGQRWWQTLPVNPVGAGYSPYSGMSSFAGNPLLISLDDLTEDGLLRTSELETLPEGGPVDYERTVALRSQALRRAHARFNAHPELRESFEEFRAAARSWLPDYALYCSLRERYRGGGFVAFPKPLLHHERTACDEAQKRFADEVGYFEFEQWCFDRQWRALQQVARDEGVGLIGDLPIFVSHDSADVWAHQPLFRLDGRGQPTHVSGVPPDAFSKTGQRWGTPVYRWQAHVRENFSFWVERIRAQLSRFDLVRLDHFIGFARSWSIPASAETAEHGRWVQGPGDALFHALSRALAKDGDGSAMLPLIAEDLGCVNRRVRELRKRLGLPGMRVLQFAFDPEGEFESEHLPHNHPVRSVAYTGTHDSDTMVGWLEDRGGEGSTRSVEQCESERAHALAYAFGPGAATPDEPAHFAMIRTLFASRAFLAMVPMQDWLGLDGTARMNVPGRADGNWTYRMRAGQASDGLAEQMRSYTLVYGRTR